jgi:hypothetical protein
MPDEDNVIDVEAEEISDSADNLPAVIPKPTAQGNGTHESAEPMPESADAPHTARDWSTYSRPERRCTAHSSRTGEQCKNVAIKGHNVCRYHGGAAKQIKRAAQTRLDNAAEVMAKQLLGIALSADSEAVKLAAVKDALDRTIGKAPTTVEIGPTKPYEEVLEGISTMTRAESRRARGVPDTQDNFAGVDHAHLHASSQEGAERQSCTPTAQSDSPDSTDHGDRGARRKSFDPTTDTGDFDYQGANRSGQYGASDSPDSPMHRSGPRHDDRDGQSERRQRPRSQAHHITGDDAIRLANEANRAIGALPSMRELESPHKRYRRP